MTKTVITPPEFAEWLAQAKVPLSLVVKHENTIYISGMPPIIPNTKDLRTDSVAGQVAGAGQYLTLFNGCWLRPFESAEVHDFRG